MEPQPNRIKQFIRSFPLWLRKATRDTIVGFVSALLVGSIANLNEAGINALIVGLGVAAGNAFARNAGDFFAWINEVLGTND